MDAVLRGLAIYFSLFPIIRLSGRRTPAQMTPFDLVIVVDLFKRYSDEGDNPGLKAWAASTRPVLEHHLQMAKDLNKIGLGARRTRSEGQVEHPALEQTVA
ncbi:hypothetical protein GGD57_003832 [Rhizobium esperanzae]|uniref:DUF4142 domain-containing protein n=1 Tax=Rhizobium esperanzae TaxID=1967781 RepID=A0A7W6R6Q6_9HYPH|nr:hypothetical protein [Rhizobium esperanzae]